MTTNCVGETRARIKHTLVLASTQNRFVNSRGHLRSSVAQHRELRDLARLPATNTRCSRRGPCELSRLCLSRAGAFSESAESAAALSIAVPGLGCDAEARQRPQLRFGQVQNLCQLHLGQNALCAGRLGMSRTLKPHRTKLRAMRTLADRTRAKADLSTGRSLRELVRLRPSTLSTT